MTLKSASNPLHKQTFSLFRERELPWSAQSSLLSTVITTSLKEENDYDSDAEQICKAQEKMRRDLK